MISNEYIESFGYGVGFAFGYMYGQKKTNPALASDRWVTIEDDNGDYKHVWINDGGGIYLTHTGIRNPSELAKRANAKIEKLRQERAENLKKNGVGDGRPHWNKNPQDTQLYKDLTKNKALASRNHFSAIRDIAQKCPNSKVRAMWANSEKDISITCNNGREGTAYYLHGEDIHMNIDRDDYERSGRAKYSTFFHEAGHNIDVVHSQEGLRPLSATYENGKFKNDINAEIGKYVSKHEKAVTRDFERAKKAGNLQDWLKKSDLSKIYPDKVLAKIDTLDKHDKNFLIGGRIREELKKEYPRNYGAVSDIISGHTKGSINACGGHSPSYWYSSKDKLPTEAFANMSSLSMTSPEEYRKLKRKLLKTSCKTYENMAHKIATGEL